MDYSDRKKAAAAFAADWRGRGYEKGDAQVFWTELLRDVVGIKKVSAACRFEYRTASGGFIDCLIPDAGVLVEQKALGVDLDKPELRQGRMVTPFEQALAYAESFPRNRQPRFIVVCNFETFRVHDRDACARNELTERYFEFSLEELGGNPHLLDFITDPANSRAEKEKQVSMEAGRLIGELHSMLQDQYIDPESAESQKALNILCVRLVFCLFCEDAELFPKDAFLDYLRKVEPENMRAALKRLFKALDTPLADRDPYDETVRPFPYVNGGLFAEEVEIPNFTQEIKHKLLFEVSQQTDWSAISPTIFGGIFESTLNPETRRAGGMHYTSPENIHKVIDPLFLDGLQAELDAIRAEEGQTPRKRKNALRKFRKKLVSLKFLDPACGSGNFLTETYLSLRRLEDDVLSELNDGQVEIAFGEDAAEDEDRVRLSQFHGIEVNDFAVRVAQTAMWIAQLQANNETDMLLDINAEDFPLRDSANIVEANALRIDWNDVLPVSECSYIMGNPPFLGHATRTTEQATDLKEVWGRNDIGRLDYVTGWFKKALDYCPDNADWAFVSTNSISQGEPVEALFSCIFQQGWRIRFAHRTFVWENEAFEKAHVHVVIVGFSKKPGASLLCSYDKDGSSAARTVSNINGYLLPAPNVFVSQRRTPLSPILSTVTMGNMPRGESLIIEPDDYPEAMADPIARKYVRRFVMGKELIHSKDRYCLWMVDADLSDISRSPFLSKRIAEVRRFRLASSAASTRAMADTPYLFGQRAYLPNGTYVGIPSVFSSNRTYATCDLLDARTVPGNKIYVCDDPDGLQFSIISSRFFILWQKAVGGRLKSDCNFSNTIVWNNFPVPELPESSRDAVIRAGQNILATRKRHPGRSLAEQYDGISPLPSNPKPSDFGKYDLPEYFDLKEAHRELDAAVEAAYGVDFNGDEEKIVAHLFKLYAELTEGE